MVYCDEEFEEEEELEEEDFDEEDDEEEVHYYYIEEVRRNGDIFTIRVSDVDSVVLELGVEQVMRLVRDAVKLMSKDEIKQLMAMLIDLITR
jgi:hypothetical protein